MTMKLVYLLVLFQVTLCLAYDIVLDDKNDVRSWKFKGKYVYKTTLIDGGGIAPAFQRPVGSQPAIANGVWYFAHTKHRPVSDDFVNYGEIKFTLTHHLMAEVIVRLLAHPLVVVEMHGSRGKLLQKFKSTGKGWCDASFDVWNDLGSEVCSL